MSMNPGLSTKPLPSITVPASASAPGSAIRAIRPSTIATSAM